jgi:uncharacterized protein YfaS (alpha-2-macroglobulin family)
MRHGLIALMAGLLWLGSALAQPVDFPGLAEDAAAYQTRLEQRFPAGASARQRAAAEQRAEAAGRRQDWAAAASAWEERAGAGEARAEHWLALARAQLRRTPPEAARAAEAAWQAFALVPAGPPEIPSLLVLAEAFQRLNQPLMRLRALEAAAGRDPENAALRRTFAEARRAAGLLVARINLEPEAEPARACIRFTSAPARRGDWQPADWLRADPPIPDLAVTREQDAICAAGLPHGRTTRLTLRAGLPGEDGLRLDAETVVPVAMPDRAPRLAFDNRAFILPRGQEAQVPLALVNVSAAQLTVVRVTERNLVRLGRQWRPGEAPNPWMAGSFAEEWGRVVWQGAIELPRLEANRMGRIALPLPAAVRQSGPGLYALIARIAGGGDRERQPAILPLIVTDLGLTAWRGASGLAVQARSLGDAMPAAGVRIALLARSNDILAEAMTGADGLARFEAPLLRGRAAMAPVALHAGLGDDLVTLDLEAAAFDLSDRGADGLPNRGPLDAFLWLDRGIYRPGETVEAMALLRDAAGRPVDLPARLRLRRPNGSIAAEFVPNPSEGGALRWAVALPASAPAGGWTIEALADPEAPPIGTASFRVDAFVPERLAVELGAAPGPLVPGQPLPLPLTARFLYGAPGAGLSGAAELRLVTSRNPFAQWPGFRFGLEEEVFAPDLLRFEIAPLDAAGRGSVPLLLPRAPDTTRPLSAEVMVSVDEPGGTATRVTTTLPVAATPRLLGIRPLFEGGAVDAGAEAAFEAIATDAAGAALAGRLRLRLLRERPDWRIVRRGGVSRFETVWTDEPVDSAEVTTTAETPVRFARRLPFGRYRLEAEESGGLALASLRFRAGWAGGETAEVPDKVDVSADRRAYAPGETARLRIASPFAGRANLAVLTDRLLALSEIEVPEAGTEIEVPVDGAWGAGAHIAVTVFRPGEAASGAPRRALGLAWLQIEPASRRLGVEIAAPARARPGSRVEVRLRIAGAREPARVTLAAVDEGILSLTRFASPDPLTHFLGRRRLGTDIRDDYGRLIAPTDAPAAALRQGGDGLDGLGALPIPRRNVALFQGPVATDASGEARITLDLPDFAGELRLMAVAWEGERIGSAARAMTVRDPVLAEAALPRFLAPGDEVRVPLLLHNLELPEGEIAVSLAAEGAIALEGPARFAARLATGERAQPVARLRASGEGEGVLRLSVSGPEGFSATREARIAVRSSRAPRTLATTETLAPGAELRLTPDASRFVPGSWRATARFGVPVRFDAMGMLAALEAFPLGCTEQLASQALGLAAAMDETGARAAALQRAMDGVLARQRFDGLFGLWSAQGAAEGWLSAYAVEALLRARAAGAAVAPAALNAALDALEAASDESGEGPEFLATQAARLHALALGGRVRLGAARRLWESLERLPTPLARAQLGAVFARAGDMDRATRGFAAALAAPARRDWLIDYGSAARDALAVLVLLHENTAPAAQLQEAGGRLPGPELTPALASTQEQGWAVLAAAALGRDARPVRVALDGAALPLAPIVTRGLTGPVTLRNLGEAPVPVTLSLAGIPRDPLPAGREGLRIARRFLTLDGQPVDLDRLRIGQEMVLLLEGRAESGQDHLAMVSQGLPAGVEITARLGAGPVPGLPFLGELTAVDAAPALDDRFAAAVTLRAREPVYRLAARLRVTHAGRFELPGAEVSDMYRPAFFARQAAGHLTIGE